LELDQRVGAIGLRHRLNIGTLDVLAITSQVVPYHFAACFRNRESKAAVGEVVDAVATIDQRGLTGSLLDLVIDSLRQTYTAMGLVDRHLVGFRIAFEQGNLTRRQVLFML